MGKLIDRKSSPATRSELALFDLPSTQVVFDSSQWLSFPPVTNLTPSGPFNFVINDSRHFLQTSKMYISFTLKCSAPETVSGAVVIGPPKSVSFINYIGATFFDQVKMFINNVQVFDCPHYAYKSYLECLLNYSSDYKRGFLQGAGYFEDSEQAIDSSSNEGYLTRVKMLKSGEINVCAPLHIDHFNVDRLLVPHMNIQIALYRNKNPFIFETHGDTDISKITLDVTSMKLHVRAIDVVSSASLALEKTMLSFPAKYPYKRTRTKVVSIPGGRFDYLCGSLFTDHIPRRIVVGFVDSESFEGNTKSPFNFKHCDIGEISIDAGGKLVPSVPLSMDFENKNYAEAFVMFHENLGFISQGHTVPISYKKYANGCSLFVFNLSPSDDNGDFEMIRSETTLVNIKFKEKTPLNGFQMIVYAEYDGVFHVDHYRNVLMDTQ